MMDVYCVKIFGLKKILSMGFRNFTPLFRKSTMEQTLQSYLINFPSHPVQGAQNLKIRFLKIDTCTNIMIKRNLIIQFEKRCFS